MDDDDGDGDDDDDTFSKIYFSIEYLNVKTLMYIKFLIQIPFVHYMT